MQEGALSLMQLVKTSAALARLAAEGLLYISVMTNPTTGGTTASFASLGDVIIAEPGALIGFAGPRVIKQTIQQELPKGFQTSEFLIAHGMVDLIAGRKEMKRTLAEILSLFNAPPFTAAMILSLIHISEPTRLLSNSYAVFCLKKKKDHFRTQHISHNIT